MKCELEYWWASDGSYIADARNISVLERVHLVMARSTITDTILKERTPKLRASFKAHKNPSWLVESFVLHVETQCGY